MTFPIILYIYINLSTNQLPPNNNPLDFCSLHPFLLHSVEFLEIFIVFSSMLTSQGLVLATAMAVSAGTLFLLDHLREKYFPNTPQVSENEDFTPGENQVAPKSCLSSGSKKKSEKEQKKSNNKKRVRFADDVKDSKGNGELYRKEHRRYAEIQKKSCGNEILGNPKMPPNRAVLYSGILKDRVQRMEYSY